MIVQVFCCGVIDLSKYWWAYEDTERIYHVKMITLPLKKRMLFYQRAGISAVWLFCIALSAYFTRLHDLVACQCTVLGIWQSDETDIEE